MFSSAQTLGRQLAQEQKSAFNMELQIFLKRILSMVCCMVEFCRDGITLRATAHLKRVSFCCHAVCHLLWTLSSLSRNTWHSVEVEIHAPAQAHRGTETYPPTYTQSAHTRTDGDQAGVFP